jgi:REP element-mobilizing transposase RayT
MKSQSGNSINQLLGRSSNPVWQRGFHDHALRRDEDIVRVARYIVANPLRAGLVSRIGDYPLWDSVWV